MTRSESTRKIQIKNRAKWNSRISKINIIGHANVLHHDIESKLASLYFDIAGRVDKDAKRPSITNLAQYFNMTPWTVRRELRLRAELLFCKPMKRVTHNRLHVTLRSKGIS